MEHMLLWLQGWLDRTRRKLTGWWHTRTITATGVRISRLAWTNELAIDTTTRLCRSRRLYVRVSREQLTTLHTMIGNALEGHGVAADPPATDLDDAFKED